jgi:type II secretory pathway component PulK
VKARAAAAPPPDAGLALVFVLLVLAVLLATVAEFARAMRLEALTVGNFRAALGESWLAEAGYQRALAEIFADAVDHELDVQGRLVFRRSRLVTPEAPERIDLALGSGRFSYRITDEGARINVNRATRGLLERLLGELDVEPAARDVIVDSIQDWRDPNEEHRLNGAESDYYLALPVPYRSKNADFDTVDELLQVRGMTREILHGRPGTPGLAELVTVWGSGALNVNTASPAVLRAVGFAPAEVDLLVGRRPYVDLQDLPPALRRGSQRTRSDAFRIEAWAGGPEPAGRVLVAIVQRRIEQAGTVEPVPVLRRWVEAPRRAAGGRPARPDGPAERSPRA